MEFEDFIAEYEATLELLQEDFMERQLQEVKLDLTRDIKKS